MDPAFKGFLIFMSVLLVFAIVVLLLAHTKKNRTAFKELDKLNNKQGYITRTQIMNSGLSQWLKHFFLFNAKRSSDYRWDYKLPDNTTYEYFCDIPEDKQHLAELYFYNEDEEDLDDEIDDE